VRSSAKLVPTTQHCCEAMARHVNWHCDQHDDLFDCPDAVVLFSARFQEYGLIIHNGGTSSFGIGFCPWCGQRLPTSQRDRWFEELERRGIDPWEDEIPSEFQDDRWLHGASER
jgi:uncharacterized protein DUF6980